MRSVRLFKWPMLLSLAAATTLLAPAAAGASVRGSAATKHPSPNRRCAVNINVAPRLIGSGDSVLVFGRLRCHGTGPNGAAFKTVMLLQHAVGTPGFTVVSSATTDVNGFYELSDPSVSVDSTFVVRSHGAASGSRTVRVTAQVTLTGPPEGTQLYTGAANKVTFSGTVSPADEGARVILQRQNAVTGNEWHRIDQGVVTATGSFSVTHTFVVPGDANIRVLLRSQRRNVPSPSNVLTYEISQSENPALTIQGSPDPITYGQSITISGTVAGAAYAPVTLLAHTARQHGFAPIAEVKTTGADTYTFPAQSPVASTFYEVKGAGKVSAVLYEGVKDVLTAQVSQTTIQAGKTLTFSGTVTPDHTGHVIYLERQNASGTGFHVVELGTVTSGSVYSIPHTVYDTGTKVFRVKIPGGPENGGAASQTFTIIVTPAPAPALTPEAPGNSALPPEGQT
jgi:phage protein U